MLSSKIIKLLIAAAGLLLSACAAVGPDYVKPAVAIPPAFKESEGWKVAQPKDPVLPERWWQLFHDPVLNELEEQVSISNQNIAVAEAQFRQARALTDASRAASYPTVSVGASATRAQTSANTGRGQSAIATDFLLPANLSWEIDLWGRIRRSVEASSATFQASAAELAAARLSAQAALATNYYQLRSCPADRSGN